MAFSSAGLSKWTEAKRYIDDLKMAVRKFEISLTGPLGQLALYLEGVYYQGVGDFDKALQIFGDAKLDLTTAKSAALTSADQLERDLAILAALNTLWIVQDRGLQDLDRNLVLKEKLEPLCVNHQNVDIRMAFQLVGATVQTNPPLELIEIKSRLKSALACGNTTSNILHMCICLSIMCSRFFNGVVGPQAEKSARAASVQATKSGNALWMSVTDGMLARCYEVQGKTQDAQASMASAQRYAEQALPGV